jgi:ATP-binding cassette, subfamily B, bacterial PglK
LKIFTKILAILSSNERKNFLFLFVMVLIMSLLDVAGVASILPFIAVLANPGLIETNPFLAYLNQLLGYTDVKYFLFFLGSVVLLLLIISLGFKALTTYALLRFSIMREYTIGKRFVEGYLHQPYSWFLSKHSADISKTILSEVGTYIGNGLMPLMTIIAQSIVALAMLSLLIIVNPFLAFSAGLLFICVYGLIIRIISNYLFRIGNERLKANEKRFKVVSEAFGSIKEIKVGGLENSYIKQFSRPAKTYSDHSATSQILAQLPRYLLELIAFGGMLFVILYLMAGDKSFSNILPIVTLYALAGYRLIPAFQLIYSNIAKIRFVGPALDVLYDDISNLESVRHESNKDLRISFEKSLVLSNIIFHYPEISSPSINDINLSIPALGSIGIVGTTGSGKTTLMDIMLGLLEPQKGDVLVDDIKINNNNRRQWQKSVGYVPQEIYLVDDSIAANIALGVSSDDIDYQNIERCSRLANLHDFVISELPQSYLTKVGEKGIRLSGGQRQRIGIARALYHYPSILFLDEATSALDNLTELEVMNSIRNLKEKVTIVIIAHRLNTIRQCDHIYVLNKGKIESQGNYEDLNIKSDIFKTINTKKK